MNIDHTWVGNSWKWIHEIPEALFWCLFYFVFNWCLRTDGYGRRIANCFSFGIVMCCYWRWPVIICCFVFFSSFFYFLVPSFLFFISCFVFVLILRRCVSIQFQCSFESVCLFVSGHSDEREGERERVSSMALYSAASKPINHPRQLSNYGLHPPHSESSQLVIQASRRYERGNKNNIHWRIIPDAHISMNTFLWHFMTPIESEKRLSQMISQINIKISPPGSSKELLLHNITCTKHNIHSKKKQKQSKIWRIKMKEPKNKKKKKKRQNNK